MTAPLARGYATAGADDGHTGRDRPDANWARGHPEKINDFGYRAVHQTAVQSKAILKALCGKNPTRATARYTSRYTITLPVMYFLRVQPVRPFSLAANAPEESLPPISPERSASYSTPLANRSDRVPECMPAYSVDPKFLEHRSNLPFIRPLRDRELLIPVESRRGHEIAFWYRRRRAVESTSSCFAFTSVEFRVAADG